MLWKRMRNNKRDEKQRIHKDEKGEYECQRTTGMFRLERINLRWRMRKITLRFQTVYKNAEKRSEMKR